VIRLNTFRSGFTLLYTQAPNDSGVTNFVGTVSPSTGFITPFAVGFTKATGMVFVPDSGSSEDSNSNSDSNSSSSG
jgi:hypothetical protein